jgi:hypothetical protein
VRVRNKRIVPDVSLAAFAGKKKWKIDPKLAMDKLTSEETQYNA